MEISKIKDTNSSVTFKAINVGPTKATLFNKFLDKDIAIFSMNEICTKSFKSQSKIRKTPYIGEFLSDMQMKILSHSPNYKRTFLTETDLSKIMQKYSNTAFEKLCDIMDNPRNIKISDIFEYFDQIRLAKKSGDPEIYNNTVKKITEKLETKID